MNQEYESLKKAQLADFGGDEEMAAEFSVHKTCKGDSGYHCSCYDIAPSVGRIWNGECDICGEVNPEFATNKI